jgi:hypothetical protein
MVRILLGCRWGGAYATRADEKRNKFHSAVDEALRHR